MSHFRTAARLMVMSTVIVIGGGYAGLMAANRALARGHAVTLVTDREHFVDRIRLHEVVAGTRTPSSATRPLRLRKGGVLVLARAEQVGDGWVELDDGSRRQTEHVVLATGSGAAAGGWEWALRHREAVAALSSGQRVCVRGGGFTGLEVATEVAAARPDLRLTILDPRPVGEGFSPRGRAHLTAALDRLGITTTSAPVQADHEIDCTGLVPDGLAARSDLPVTPSGAVVVDDHLRVRGFERLWACGDAAVLPTQPHLRMACATAEPMAAHVADQLTRLDQGEPLKPLSLGYAAWCLSLGRDDGLIQYVRRDDTATDRVTTGRGAAVVKALVCRFAVVMTTRFNRFYRELEGPECRVTTTT